MSFSRLLITVYCRLPPEWQAGYLPLLNDWLVAERRARVEALREKLKGNY